MALQRFRELQFFRLGLHRLLRANGVGRRCVVQPSVDESNHAMKAAHDVMAGAARTVRPFRLSSKVRGVGLEPRIELPSDFDEEKVGVVDFRGRERGPDLTDTTAEAILADKGVQVRVPGSFVCLPERTPSLGRPSRQRRAR